MTTDPQKNAQQADAIIQRSLDEAQRQPSPAMPTVADANALTRETERLSQDPKNQSKP